MFSQRLTSRFKLLENVSLKQRSSHQVTNSILLMVTYLSIPVLKLLILQQNKQMGKKEKSPFLW